MRQHTSKTVLLVMDMQLGIVGQLPHLPLLLERVKEALQKARKNGVPVIYVHVGFRKGLPEIDSNNAFFGTLKARLASVNMEEWMQIHPEVAPQKGEIVILKRRISAFTGSDLEVVLRAGGITHLILAGVSTSGVVLSTTREAADKDYILTILSDACTDNDAEAHRVLMENIFPKQATVVSVSDWKA